ncbi:MAG: hypothetical protein AAGK21_00220, partial [Bacteroidota bacterium]
RETDTPPQVYLRALGGYVEVASVARRGRAEATVTAQVAQRPPEALRAAVVWGDTLSPLTLGGGTTVTGEVVTGPRGWTTGTLTRRPFRGGVDGPSTAMRGDPLPALDASTFQETLDRLGAYLDAAPVPEARVLVPAAVPEVTAGEGPYADSVSVFMAAPGAVLTALDVRALPEVGRVVVLCAGDLRLDGPLRLPTGTQVAARGRLDVTESVEGEGVLLTADRVRVEGDVSLQGQVLARRALTVGGGSRFSFPSVLYVAGPSTSGAALARDDRLEIEDAVVEGSVIYAAGEGLPVEAGGREAARLVASPEAVLRGVVYAARRAEVRGLVEGTLLARGLYLFDSPAVYVGWLVDATVDREARPDPFYVPVGLGREPSFEVVQQRASVRRVAPVAGGSVPRVSGGPIRLDSAPAQP